MHWEILRGFLLGAGPGLRAEGRHVLGGLVEARTGTKLALYGDSLQAGRLPGGWALPRGEEATCWRAPDGYSGGVLELCVLQTEGLGHGSPGCSLAHHVTRNILQFEPNDGQFSGQLGLIFLFSV